MQNQQMPIKTNEKASSAATLKASFNSHIFRGQTYEEYYIK